MLKAKLRVFWTQTQTRIIVNHIKHIKQPQLNSPNDVVSFPRKILVWFGGCFMWTGEGIIHHDIPLYPIISPYWWLNLANLFGDGDPEIRRSKRPWRSRPLAFEQFLAVALEVKTKGKKLGKKYDDYIYIYTLYIYNIIYI